MNLREFRISYRIYVSAFLAGLPLLALLSSFIDWAAFEDPYYIIIIDAIMICTLILMLLLFNTLKNFRNYLTSQNILLLITGIEIIFLIFTLVSNQYLLEDNTRDALLFFQIASMLRDIQPLLFVYYISLFIKPRGLLAYYFLAIVIFVSPIALSLVDLFGTLIVGQSFSTYAPYHAAPITAITLTISFATLGIFTIYEIFRTRTLQSVFYEPLLARQYFFIYLGTLLFFFVSPLLVYSPMILGTMPTLNLFLFSKYLRLFSLLVFALPHFFGNDVHFNLIPQSVEKLVVMNPVGLPLMSYDFGYEERVIHSDLLVTSSLTAIVTYLTHAQILSSRISSINFEDRQLVFRVTGKLTFLVIVKTKTKIIDSALDVFVKNFLDLVPSEIIHSGYLGPEFNKQIAEIRTQIIEEAFGTNISSVHGGSSKEYVKKLSIEKFSLSRTIMALVFAYSSLRLVYFIGTTILIPVDGDLVSLIPAILYSTIFYFGPLVTKKLRISEFSNFIVTVTLFFVIQLTTGAVVTMILIWFFSLSSWNHLYTIWHSVFPRISIERRIQIIILSMILDMGLRAYNFGTDLSVSANTNPLFIIVSVIIIITFLAGFRDNNLDLPKEDAKSTKISFYLFTIILPLAIRFSLNISQILVYVRHPTLLLYLEFGFVFLLILSLSLSHQIMNFLVELPWFRAVIFLIPTFLILGLSFNTPLSTILVIISPLSYAVMSSFYDDQVPFPNLVKKLMSHQNTVLVLTPSILFLIMVITYYGTSILFLMPITLGIGIVNILLAKDRFSYAKLSNRSSYSLMICFLFLSSLLMPFNVSLDNPNPTEKIGIMTYNIHYGVDAGNEYDPVSIAEFISQSGVSIVGLQEVTRSSIINGNGDLLLQLVQSLQRHGFEYMVFMEGSAEIFTNAIFSKYPIIEDRSVLFEAKAIFKKGMITAKIQINDTVLDIGNTHLTHDYTEASNMTRIKQTADVINYYDFSLPSILLGDFNVQPDDVEIQMLLELFNDAGATMGTPTWPYDNPSQRIDFIFHQGISPVSFETVNVPHSDHLPVIAWFDI